MRTLAILALAIPALAAAQPQPAREAPQGPPRQGGPGPGQGPRPGFQDHGFPYAQLLRAMDEKVTLLLETGRTEAALDELRRVPSLSVPRDHPVYEGKAHLWFRLAMTYLNHGKRKDALETMKALLEDVPAGTVAEATAWLNAGTLYKQAGMSEEALKAFDRAIALSEKLAREPRGPAGIPMPPGGRPPAPQ